MKMSTASLLLHGPWMDLRVASAQPSHSVCPVKRGRGFLVYSPTLFMTCYSEKLLSSLPFPLLVADGKNNQVIPIANHNIKQENSTTALCTNTSFSQ